MNALSFSSGLCAPLWASLLALATFVQGALAINFDALPPMQLHTGSTSGLYTDGIRDSSFTLWGDPNNFASSDLDANGWTIRLPDVGDKIWYAIEDCPEVYGVHVITWEGTGTIAAKTPGNQEVVLLSDQVNRRIVALNPEGVELRVEITSIDENDHLRNIRCWRPASAGAGSSLTSNDDLSVGNVAGSLEPASGQTGPLFHPVRLQQLGEGNPGPIRFMG